MSKRLRLFALALWLLAGRGWAAELRLFEADSPEAIRAARPGRPFALVLWSLECAHCREEFALLAKAKRQRPDLDLVLVSTDGPEAGRDIVRTLRAAGLGRAEAWVFGADAPERLRWAIDSKWRGELPRTYLFDAAHQAAGISGRLTWQQLADWSQTRSRR